MYSARGCPTSQLSAYFADCVANAKPYPRRTPSLEPTSNTSPSTGPAPANEGSETQPARRNHTGTSQLPQESEPGSSSQPRTRRQRKTKRKDQTKVSEKKVLPASETDTYTQGGRALRNTKARASRITGSSMYNI